MGRLGNVARPRRTMSRRTTNDHRHAATHKPARTRFTSLVRFPPPPAGTWPVPTAAHGASFAVRNLPHDTDPERAVNLMEATVAAAPELKRRHGVKGWKVRVPENQPSATRCTGKRDLLTTKNFSFTRH